MNCQDLFSQKDKKNRMLFDTILNGAYQSFFKLMIKLKNKVISEKQSSVADSIALHIPQNKVIFVSNQNMFIFFLFLHENMWIHVRNLVRCL